MPRKQAKAFVAQKVENAVDHGSSNQMIKTIFLRLQKNFASGYKKFSLRVTKNLDDQSRTVRP